MGEFIERGETRQVLGDMLEDVMDRVDGRFFYTDDSHGHRYIVVDVTTKKYRSCPRRAWWGVTPILGHWISQ